MKKTYALAVLGATAIILGSLSGLTVKNTMAASRNCTDTSSNPYAILCSDSDSYKRGEKINFTLYQNKIPLFIGPEEKPWKIIDSRGRTVYEPASPKPDEMPAPAFSFSDSWDQSDMRGRTVPRGSYYIAFESKGYSVPQLKIDIMNGVYRDPRVIKIRK